MADILINGEAPLPDPVQTVDAPVVDAPVDETAALGDAYDRLTKETNRDELGRFAADGTKIVSPDQATGAQDDGVKSVVADPPATGTLAPAHLPQAIKANWDKYGPEGQAAITAHQDAMDRKFGEVGRQLETVKPFADTLSAAMKQIPECASMSPTEMAQAAIHLAVVQSDMNKNPVGTLMQIAEQYGIIPQLQAIMAGQEYTPPANQGTVALERQIAELKSQLERNSNPETIRTEISKTMKEKDAEAVTQKFIAGDGKDYWADVEAKLPTFIKLVLDEGGQKTQEQVLSAAYNMAINAIPEVRAKVRAAEAKATAAGPDPKHAEAARKAVSINIKPTANGKDAPLTEEQAIGMAYDRAMAN